MEFGCTEQEALQVLNLIRSYNGSYISKIATIDGVVCHVPINTANTHYQAIQEWVSAGNTIEEAD